MFVAVKIKGDEVYDQTVTKKLRDTLLLKLTFNHFFFLPHCPKISSYRAQASHVDFTEYFMWTK